MIALSDGLKLTVIAESWRHANAYLLEGDEGLLIDPGFPCEAPFASRVQKLLVTHAHYDHMAGLLSWLKDKQREFYLPAGDRSFLADPAANASQLFGAATAFPEADHYLAEGALLPIDERYRLAVIESPGHTPGSSCYLLEEIKGGQPLPLALFTGDTLFADSIGRCDLHGGSSAAMRDSLRKLRKIFGDLPPSLPVYFGHGPSSTIGAMLQGHPYLQEQAAF